MHHIFACFGRYTKDAALAALCTVGEVLMEVLLPFVMAFIIDQGVEAGDMGAIGRYGLIMIAMAFASLAFGAASGTFAARASTGVAANVREAVFDKVQTYSFANIDKFSTAGLVTRMTTDVTNVQNAVLMCLRVGLRSPIMLISSLCAAISISARLSWVFGAAIVFLALALGIIMVVANKRFSLVFDTYDDLNASVQENIGAIRVVKAFVREQYENSKFKRAVETLYRRFVSAEGLVAFNNPIMMVAVYACVLGLSWFGARFVVAGSMSTGQLTSMFSYIMQVLMSLMMLSMIIVMITMSMTSIRRISQALDEVPDIANPEQPVRELADGSIDFSHVSFSYAHGSGENVLQDIDLHIASGETIGIIGGTGSGKSSLVNLICRLYDASEGSVRVGGRDVRDYDLDTLRCGVAMVLQKNVLFSGTIYENLRWGDERATDEECREACRAACADEFIDQLPDGYDTFIERGGTNVSGGQKQRLCIARALLKHPKVLILDDSTSAVDTKTDALIREGLATYLPDTTKIIIAQRTSSVEHADRILILDNGHIAGLGTHDELMETCDIYRDTYIQQNRTGEDEAGTEAEGDADAQQTAGRDETAKGGAADER